MEDINYRLHAMLGARSLPKQYKFLWRSFSNPVYRWLRAQWRACENHIPILLLP